MNAPTNSSVIPLDESFIDRALDINLAAYREDPFALHIFPPKTTLPGQAAWFYIIPLRYGIRFGEVFTTADIAGVAVWLGPEKPDMTFLNGVRIGLLMTPFRIGREAFRRFMDYAKILNRAHKRLAPPKHFYLLNLAVDPAHQGMGIGGHLIHPVLDKADDRGLACYLETMNERAVGFYEKHGFTVTELVTIPTGGPPFWAMIRKPRG